jgi:hypothetical protein
MQEYFAGKDADKSSQFLFFFIFFFYLANKKKMFTISNREKNNYIMWGKETQKKP